MVFSATFNNISVMEETGVPRGNHRPVASHWQTIMLYRIHLAWVVEFELATLVVIGS